MGHKQVGRSYYSFFKTTNLLILPKPKLFRKLLRRKTFLWEINK